MPRTAEAPIEQELETYRKALTGYCYRMIGSGAEAEDAVQETMVRAWKSADKLQERGALKAWLFRIANNVCLDMLGSAQRRATPMDMGPSSSADGPLGEMIVDSAWVRPIADVKVLEPTADPAELAASKESLRLAFVAALQNLPPKQRAVLILREVLRWQASEVADLLDTSVASVNSALQRARATIEQLDLDESGAAEVDEAEQKELLSKYVKAFEAYDMTALTALLKDDAAFSMPPFPLWVVGPEQIEAFMRGKGAKCEGSKVLVTSANGGPAFGIYNPTPEGDYAGWAVVVMETSAGRISGLHHFIYPELFAEFGLPLRLDGEHVGEADELQQPA
ncbi:sigma-70 family RNA polymerase sigma factor [Solirubrobacter sp. CPCC 204708]|uniref:Sigma-70 family RNA polymerase sigma factor n=1 Tax=Solirubrobacter deserti TaxID=2282478 RepID=A0ABT4RIY4_9ACTN|nr:sigma-70 family RNA polymerase sigma factor [Solirubrobacter deserti]MBE2320798.1 sigma-70 family RNA polymerase sigma factor [Solirubrobacter deserti]MDA0138433.1 sigma-70 family RNA polymerase sigma factor [Solirubrobacter deserti]